MEKYTAENSISLIYTSLWKKSRGGEEWKGGEGGGQKDIRFEKYS